MFFFLDMNASKRKIISPEIFKVYLALVYIMPNAPVLINVDKEIKVNIVSRLTGMKGGDPAIFDDAYHEVCWSLKLVTDSFLKKHPLNDLGSTDSKSLSFKINLKDTLNILERLFSESNVNIGKVTEKSIAGFIASATNLDKLAVDRNQILTKVQSRFFANKKELDLTCSYYLENIVDKALLVDKNYKLKKKFG